MAQLYPSILTRYQQVLSTEAHSMDTTLHATFIPGPDNRENLDILMGDLNLDNVLIREKDNFKVRML